MLPSWGAWRSDGRAVPGAGPGRGCQPAWPLWFWVTRTAALPCGNWGNAAQLRSAPALGERRCASALLQRAAHYPLAQARSGPGSVLRTRHRNLTRQGLVSRHSSLTRRPSPAGTYLDGARLEPRARARLAPGQSTVTLGRCPAAFQLSDGAAARGSDAPDPPARREAAADGSGAPDSLRTGAPDPEALHVLDGADAPRAARRYRSAGRGSDAGEEPGPDPRRAADPADERRGGSRGADAAAAEGDGPAGSGAWERHDGRGGCVAGRRAERDRGWGGDGAGARQRAAHGPVMRSQASPDGCPRADRLPERGRPDRPLGALHDRREPDARPASPRAGPGPALQRPGGPGARAGAEGLRAERSGAGRARERPELRERPGGGREDAGRRGDADGGRGESRGRLEGAEHRDARRPLRQADRRAPHPADPSTRSGSMRL